MEKTMGFSAIWKTSWTSMKGKWGILVGIVFCCNLIMGAVQQSQGALGTVLLAPLTAAAALCIGLLWLLPFLYCFMAQFYLSLRESKEMSAESPAGLIQTEVLSDQD